MDPALALALKVFAYTEMLQLAVGGESESVIVERAVELESQLRAMAREVLARRGLMWK